MIAVGLGPGSYTGVRAAIAVAQGWQLARGVKLLGVGTVEALAAQAQAEEIFGRVNVVVDAQRGEFYLGEWEISADRRVEAGPLRIVTAAELAHAPEWPGNLPRPGGDPGHVSGRGHGGAPGRGAHGPCAGGTITAHLFAGNRVWERPTCASALNSGADKIAIFQDGNPAERRGW